MTITPYNLPRAQDRRLFDDIGKICREIGAMIAQIETSLIDAVHEIPAEPSSPQAIQQIDLVMQSVEELALLMDRLDQTIPVFSSTETDKVVSATRLEWMQDCLMRGKTEGRDKDNAINSGKVSLF